MKGETIMKIEVDTAVAEVEKLAGTATKIVEAVLNNRTELTKLGLGSLEKISTQLGEILSAAIAAELAQTEARVERDRFEERLTEVEEANVKAHHMMNEFLEGAGTDDE
jgi:hypothetical protein